MIKIISRMTFILFSIYGLGVFSQITIGESEPPVQGALLQIKNIPNITSSEANSTKGVGMPRVTISDKNSIQWVISGVTDANKDEHIGLLVYSTTKFGTTISYCPGLYVWTGAEWQQLRTIVPTPETETTVADVQGNIYTKASFGPAGIWMTQNMRATVTPCEEKYILSAGLGYGSKYYCYPGGTNALDATVFNNHHEYGLLYNWEAATDGKDEQVSGSDGETNPDFSNGVVANDPQKIERVGYQGICPNGWHLPSDYEYNLLEKELSENPAPYSNGGTATVWNPDWNHLVSNRGGSHGATMKSPIIIQGTTSTPVGNSKTDGKGFNWYTVGNYFNNGSNVYGGYGYLWTSSNRGNRNAWHRSAHIHEWNITKHYANTNLLFSVRCKKN